MMSRRASKVFLLALAAAGAVDGATYYAGPKGGAAGVQACVDMLQGAGDECVLKAGRYEFGTETVTVQGKQGLPGNHIAIRGEGGLPNGVVIDGTLPLPDGCTKSWRRHEVARPAQGAVGAAYACRMPEGVDVTQLFEDGDMLVPARWPNARWDDRSMFMAPENWAHSGAGGEHNLTTREGVINDGGACKNMTAECCGECNANDLAASKVNATGAVIIMNNWLDATGTQFITHHEPGNRTMLYEATWCLDQFEKRGKCGDGYRSVGRYYLEGSLHLLDAPTEWVYNKADRMLYVWTKDGEVPAAGAIRYKAQAFALDFKDSKFLALGNMSFFGTAVRGYDDKHLEHGYAPQVHSLTLESLRFDYPSAAKRMVGELNHIDSPIFWTDGHTRVAEGLTSAAWTNHTFSDIHIRYADGDTLLVQGSGNRYSNMLFEWNSWTGFCMKSGSVHDVNASNNGCGTLNAMYGAPPPPEDGVVVPQFDRITFRYNGQAKAVQPPLMPGVLIQRMQFETQLEVMGDGSLVETIGEHCADMAFNWCLSTGKMGLRFDAPGGEITNATVGGSMTNNVCWDATYFQVKGDHHNVSYNTIFDPSDVHQINSMHSLPSPQTQASDLDGPHPPAVIDQDLASMRVENPGGSYDGANTHSVFHGNVLEYVTHYLPCTNEMCPFAGDWGGDNVIASSFPDQPSMTTPFKIRHELRDPYARDFRPCPGSVVAARAAGAYKVYSRDDTEHWMPGAMVEIPSQPSPPVNYTAAMDADLIFQHAFRAVEHAVYLAPAGGAFILVETLTGAQNVAHPTLEAGARYAWRVDPIFSDGTQATGEVWTFETGHQRSCE